MLPDVPIVAGHPFLKKLIVPRKTAKFMTFKKQIRIKNEMNANVYRVGTCGKSFVVCIVPFRIDIYHRNKRTK